MNIQKIQKKISTGLMGTNPKPLFRWEKIMLSLIILACAVVTIYASF